MDHLTRFPSEVTCTIAGTQYREAAVFIATFVAHLYTYGHGRRGPYVTLATSGLSEDEKELLR